MRGPAKLFNKGCELCGETFKARTSNQKYCSQECYRLATAERKRSERGTRQQKTRIEQVEEVFLGLCSVCGVDEVPVSDCPECGYLNCDKCSDESELCSVCSDGQTALAL